MQLNKRSVAAAFTICGVALSLVQAAPVFAADNTGTDATSSSVVSSSSSSTNASAASDQANVLTSDSDASSSSSTGKDVSTDASADSSSLDSTADAPKVTETPLTPVEAETAVKQIIEIHQITPVKGAADSELANTLNKGVDGSEWKVYDVTERFNDLAKEQTSDTKDTDALEKIELQLTSEAANASKYKLVTTGTTKTVNGVAGTLDVTVEVPAHKYYAYTFVNTATPDRVEKAASFTLILPVSDDKGEFPVKQVIEPKSGVTPKPTTKLQQTGHEMNEGTTVAGLSLIALGTVGAGAIVKKRKVQ